MYNEPSYEDINFDLDPPNTSFAEMVAEKLGKAKARYPRWTDAYGKKWQPRDMSDGHLCNTIRMLGRRFSAVQMSDDALGYDHSLAARGPAALFPIYSALFNEAIRRGLTP